MGVVEEPLTSQPNVKRTVGVMSFSSIPQPDEVYRFRSVDALIGSHKELYRQTIYLAKPGQLNPHPPRG